MSRELDGIIVNGVTTAGNVTSPWVNISRCTEFSFHSKWTGTTAGAFTFEVSNEVMPPDAPQAIMGSTAFTEPAGFAAGDPAGAPGNFGFMFGPSNPVPFRWIRQVFTRSGGSGLMYTAICGKGAA